MGPDILHMNDEYEAWQRVVTAFKDLHIDINHEEKLITALLLWSEHLVELRVEQTPELREQAFEDAAKRADAAGWEVWS